MKKATLYFSGTEEPAALSALAILSNITVSNYLRMLVRQDIATRSLTTYAQLFQPTTRGGINNPEGFGGHGGKTSKAVSNAKAKRIRKDD